MQLLCRTDGTLCAVYGELVELAELGQLSISRASHVEPDVDDTWYADLSLVNGPKLTGFLHRSDALTAEREWLEMYLQDLPISR